MAAPGATSAGYGIRTTTGRSFDEAIADVRAALLEQGFGVLTEIDVRATMKTKLDFDVPAQVILGACNPAMALKAFEREPSIGLLMPCNVVVREDSGRRIVEAIDPAILVTATGNRELAPIAAEVGGKLRAALDSLADTPEAAG